MAKEMAQETAQTIHKAINDKGWNLYFRGNSDKKLGIAEMFRKGPVDSLEPGILYVILPKVADPTKKKETDAFIEKHQVSPKIKVAPIFPYFGRCVAEFSGNDLEEYFVHPGDEIDFIGIELQEKEIRLLAPTKTFMPYDVFIASLDSLQNITRLEADSKRRDSLKNLITLLKSVMLKRLGQEFEFSLPFDPHTPEGYRKLCMEYSKIVTPGIEAMDRELKRSRASTRIYT